MQRSTGFYVFASIISVALLYLVYFTYATNESVVGQVAPILLKGAFPNVRHKIAEVQTFNPKILKQQPDPNFDYKAEMQKLNEAKVSADDPRLIQLIRDYYIVPPSTEPYNLSQPDLLDHSCGQAPFVDSRMNFTEGGFYVECGALDGETSSNTLFFERYRKWNGLLVEADPINFANVMSKHRKAFAINACLSTTSYPENVIFKQAYHLGKIVKHDAKPGDAKKGETLVQCFPLYSLLLALNELTVDFFSLDVEGAEAEVLESTPFDKLNIKMIAVEYAHVHGGLHRVIPLVTKRGYNFLLQASHPDWRLNDAIFGKKGLAQ